MTKTNKKAGKILGKHLPDLEPSRLGPPRPKKPARVHAFQAEEWYPSNQWFRSDRSGCWVGIGSSDNFDQAVHIAQKPFRTFMNTLRSIKVRVIDELGLVVWEETRP